MSKVQQYSKEQEENRHVFHLELTSLYFTTKFPFAKIFLSPTNVTTKWTSLGRHGRPKWPNKHHLRNEIHKVQSAKSHHAHKVCGADWSSWSYSRTTWGDCDTSRPTFKIRAARPTRHIGKGGLWTVVAGKEKSQGNFHDPHGKPS